MRRDFKVGDKVLYSKDNVSVYTIRHISESLDLYELAEASGGGVFVCKGDELVYAIPFGSITASKMFEGDDFTPNYGSDTPPVGKCDCGATITGHQSHRAWCSSH